MKKLLSLAFSIASFTACERHQIETPQSFKLVEISNGNGWEPTVYRLEYEGRVYLILYTGRGSAIVEHNKVQP